jgi:hypothetical protein
VSDTISVGSRTSNTREREGIDEKAKRLVLQAYRERSHMGSQAGFEAALESYLSRFPTVSRHVAARAVAYILATDEF